MEKPTEIFHIAEHFCLGRRRLHLFGDDSTLRPGWLSVGPNLTSSNFSSDTYKTYFTNGPDDYLVGSTQEIESLRPKSPVGKNKGGDNSGRGGNARGGQRGGMSGRGGPRGGMRGGPGGRGMNRGGYQGNGRGFQQRM